MILVYFRHSRSITIDTTNGSIHGGEPRILFSTTVGETLLFTPGYDVSSGGRFLINSLGKSRIGSHPLNLLVNWTASLNQ